MNIGVEENKGDTLRKETFDKLKQIKGFIGNIEAREILGGNCDLIVTDGYSGNIALKSIEGTANFALGELKNIFQKNILSKIAAFIIQKDLKRNDRTGNGWNLYRGSTHCSVSETGKTYGKVGK